MAEKSGLSSAKILDDAIIIREAKPDLAEGLVFAQFFDEASEGFFKKMLGTKIYDIIADAYLKSNNEYSFENAMMIEYNSKIVGTASGYTLEEKEGFKKKILTQFSGGAKLRIMMFSVVGKVLSRFLGPRGKEDYYLQSIAVSSHIRGKGLGQRLLKHTCKIAVKKGSKTLSLDVSSKNENAIKSYKKFGMEIVSVWPDFLNLPPVFTRMAKEL